MLCHGLCPQVFLSEKYSKNQHFSGPNKKAAEALMVFESDMPTRPRI